MKKIVTIGGGSGQSQVLKALKKIKNIQITAICPGTDSGGSTGILQKEYEGSGYTGDLTKCVVALCDNKVLSRALTFRYKNGSLHNHSVKNLLFHALEKVGNEQDALEIMWKICGLGVHRVIPVTKDKTELCVKLSLGNVISGETNIDLIARNPLWNPNVHNISDIYLKPQVNASKIAIEAINQANYIVVSPGDLYSSIIPTLLPKGMKEFISKSKAKIILILNIMTKKGETDDYTATDFVLNIEKRLGRSIDYIISNNKTISKRVLLKYSLESKVELGGLKDSHDSKIIFVPLAFVTKAGQIYSDPKVIKNTLESIFSRI